MEQENLNFSRFKIQFGDNDSELNQILSTLLVSFSPNSLEFKISIINNELQPFKALSSLIRVKKIDLFLQVQNAADEIVGTIKLEDCNFLRIEDYKPFLHSFTYDLLQGGSSIKSNYNANRIKVAIDVEAISINEIVLHKKESKKMQDLQIGGELKYSEQNFAIKKKASEWENERAEKIGYMVDAGDNGVRFTEEQTESQAEKYAHDRVNAITRELIYGNGREIYGDVSKEERPTSMYGVNEAL